MSNLPEQPDDELLSAYLDGELAADELRAVEAWLASDPAAQVQLQELRSVSRAVQSLPKQSVPQEWSAELAKRLGAAVDPGSPSATQAASAADRNHRSSGQAITNPRLPVGRSLRGWWWSAAAIAAAVAIMMMMPPEGENELARNVEIDKAPATAREPLVISDGELEGRGANDRLLEESELGDSESTESALAEAAPSDEMPSERDRLSGLARREFRLEGTEPSVAAVEIEVDGTRRAPATASRPTMASSSITTESMDRADEAPAAAESSLATGSFADLPENTYFIVWADVPSETLRQRQINNLLTDNGIAVEDRTETWTAAAEPVRQQIELRNSLNTRGDASVLFGGDGNFDGGGQLGGLAGRANSSQANSSRFSVPAEDSVRSVDATAAGEPPAGQANRAGKGAKQSEGAEMEGETILVDATAEQMAACLAAMQHDTRNFSSIVVEPVNEVVLRRQFANQSTPQQLAGQPSSEAGAYDRSGDYRQTSPGNEQLLTSEEGKHDPENQYAGQSLDLAKELPDKLQPQARRLERPGQWYAYNTAPQEAWAGYQLRSQEAQAEKTNRKVAANEQAQLVDKADKMQQLDGLNRYVQEQQENVAGPNAGGRSKAPPLAPQQQVQVLFVLRNDQLPTPGPTLDIDASESESYESP